MDLMHVPAAYGQFPKESGEEPNMEEGLQHGGSPEGGRCGRSATHRY